MTVISEIKVHRKGTETFTEHRAALYLYREKFVEYENMFWDKRKLWLLVIAVVGTDENCIAGFSRRAGAHILIHCDMGLQVQRHSVLCSCICDINQFCIMLLSARKYCKITRPRRFEHLWRFWDTKPHWRFWIFKASKMLQLWQTIFTHHIWSDKVVLATSNVAAMEFTGRRTSVEHSNVASAEFAGGRTSSVRTCYTSGMYQLFPN